MELESGAANNVKENASDKGEIDQGSKSGLASGRTSRCNKAYTLLENQGIIVGKTMGSGSYAKVKSAYDIQRKHKVAIKIINKKKAFDEYIMKFLPREIDAMKSLKNHYALVKFYQIIETTSRYFFIMELAENGDLLSVIKARHSLPEMEAGRWFIHLHDGMKYMHSKGLVHRDIKCENLIISRDDVLKITDFGFAKRIGKTKSGKPSLSETYCGSFAYAPPEILKGVPYDPEMSDVWSMGVVLFTMMYGRLPFDDGEPKKLLKQVQSRIVFPSKPKVSDKCRFLIIKIFSRAAERIPLRNIKADPWFKCQHAIHVLKVEEKEEGVSEKDSTSDSNLTAIKPNTSDPSDDKPVAGTSKASSNLSEGCRGRLECVDSVKDKDKSKKNGEDITPLVGEELVLQSRLELL